MMRILLTLLLLLLLLVGVSMAQNVDGGPSPYSVLHGVSISGIAAPTITNSPSNPAILAIIWQTLSTTMNPVNHTIEMDRIVSGKLLGPGESVTWAMANTLQPRGMRMDSTGAITMVKLGDLLGYKLLAVAFDNGTFFTQVTARDLKMFAVKDGKPVLDAAGNGTFAPDSLVQSKLLEQLQTDIATVRSIGNMLAGLDPAHRTMTLSTMRNSKQASDSFQRGRAQDISDALYRLPDEDSRMAGIVRLTSLPDIVKGE